MGSPVRRAALVTGASSGIGKATASALVGAGFVTFATARRTESLSDIKGLGCRALRLDVTDEESMAAAVRLVESEFGVVSVLVNCAGYGECGPLEELDVEDVRRQFETNVFGLLRMYQLVLPGMRRRGWGRVVNVSSVGGEVSMPGCGLYFASKYAVEALSDAMRFEAKPFGVDVVVIQPGFVRTQFTERIAQSLAGLPDGESYTGLMGTVQRMVSPEVLRRIPSNSAEDVARTILQAVEARRPRTRYKISLLAHALPKVRRALPDRAWDRLLRRIFLPTTIESK